MCDRFCLPREWSAARRRSFTAEAARRPVKGGPSPSAASCSHMASKPASSSQPKLLHSSQGMDMSSVVRVTCNQDVAFVSLERPERNNALNAALIEALHLTFESIASDRSITTVVLSGEGKCLCAGADINWMREGATVSLEQNIDGLMRLGHMLKALYAMPQTTIVRAQGSNYGGGVGLVAACDIAIGSSNAMFCLSEVKLGIVPGMVSPFVQRAIGQRMARRYFQTAEVFDAHEAKRLGLLHEVGAPEELDASIH